MPSVHRLPNPGRPALHHARPVTRVSVLPDNTTFRLWDAVLMANYILADIPTYPPFSQSPPFSPSQPPLPVPPPPIYAPSPVSSPGLYRRSMLPYVHDAARDAAAAAALERLAPKPRKVRPAVDATPAASGGPGAPAAAAAVHDGANLAAGPAPPAEAA